MRRFLVVLAAAAAFAGAAQAEEANECMVSVPVTAANVAQAKQWDLSGFAGAGQTPPFIAGGLSPTRDAENAHELHGTVIFQRNADGSWRGVLPKLGETDVGMYRATNSDALVFVTMWTSEGPGQYWSVVTVRGGEGKCVSVPFPDDLNKPSYNMDFLDLADFDIGANGRGEMIGVWRDDGQPDRWYSYRTRDGGLTWERPQRLRRQRDARGGLYEPIPGIPAPAEQVAELERYAAGR